MRVVLAFTIAWCCAAAASAEDESRPAENESRTAEDAPESRALSWQEPFHPISSSEAGDSLVLMLITNEDPFDADTEREQTTSRSANAWCSQIVADSYRRAIASRSDLRSRMQLQSIVAGLPSELTGGRNVNTPARVLVALCDGNYQLLSFLVGVPDADDLLTMIEDAEDVSAMIRLQPGQSRSMHEQLVARSGERLGRLWRAALQDLSDSLGDQYEHDGEVEGSQVDPAGRMRTINEALQSPYLADVRLRFGLADASDISRLVVLEQHPQTRRPWCEAMLPFIAGSDFVTSWRQLVESAWGQPTVTADDEPARELLEWYDQLADSNTLILWHTPRHHLQRNPWPPAVTDLPRGRVGWAEVHLQATQHAFRSADAQQLAQLIKLRELRAVDLYHPSLARYLILDPARKLPLIIRESDPPGKFAGILKRAYSSLVTTEVQR